ncbi:MAG: response regulator transcription factor [Cryomorphaceae bacterium]
MKPVIKTFLADTSILILEGFKNILAVHPEIDVVGVATNSVQLQEGIAQQTPDVLVIDYSMGTFSVFEVLGIMKKYPSIRVIGIAHDCNVTDVKRLLHSGLNGHLMNDCDKDEIIGSVLACAKGEKFFCGQVLDKLNVGEGEDPIHTCEPISISERELEILQHIAEGLTTKLIAEKLHLSFHTVMTHRKNMMAKLGLNNTAGLIIYAVKENLISPNRFLFNTETTPR